MKGPSERPCNQWRIILKRISKKYTADLSGSRDGQELTFGFHKRCGISYLAEKLVASQAGPCSIKLFIYLLYQSVS
jgi:hypothetical protein